MTEDTV